MTDPSLTSGEITMCRDALLSIRHGERPFAPPYFATLSGAHLYGWADEGSDYDVRGIHMAHPQETLGFLRWTPETVDRNVEGEMVTRTPISEIIDADPDLPQGVQIDRRTKTIDIVSHEVGKFLRLLAKPNGNFLEMLHSPLIIAGGDDEELHQLKELSKVVMSKALARHYLGFYAGQMKRYSEKLGKRLRQLLYGYRVLLTGLVVVRHETVVANLPELLEMQNWCNPAIPQELMEMKRAGAADVPDGLFTAALVAQDVLWRKLEYDTERSGLLDKPLREGLNGWLIEHRGKAMMESDYWMRLRGH